ncbi:MAG: assimilatory sulfite reductase (NADPH) flavoprotein subunit [Woeseiaceae bacterium]
MNSPAASAVPLDEKQNARLRDAVTGLTAAQLQWVSGYAAGLAAATGAAAEPSLVPAAEPGSGLTILYGTQTGNAEGIAGELARQAEDRGYTTRTLSLADFKPSALAREKLVVFIVSTHGEGDPPDDAELFHEYLLSDRAKRLSGLRYSVLALGDSSYVNFCQTGREFDARLAALGAERFAALVECDLDFDAASAAWSTRVIDQLPRYLDADRAAPVPRLHAVSTTKTYDRKNPYRAEVLVNQRITGATSSKDVRHLELSIAGSGLSYEPGDALAVLTDNPPQLVAELIDAARLDPEEEVEIDGERSVLGDALRDQLEITTLNLGFLRGWAEHTGHEALGSIIAGAEPDLLRDFLGSHQVIDIVRRYPAPVSAAEFAGMLRALGPRSYSIASSPSANPDEVHLTVAAVRYEAFGREHWGAASTMLADRLVPGESVSVYVEKNPRFRLPDPDVPVVMIGPGTGVAPFRAFVEERAEQQATGGNWLFFGDRSFADDFLYQLEWQRHLKRGHLDRLDVAFSRDWHKKVYVQDRLREQGAELFRWIERGAAIYVCGDAARMAPDVETALLGILAEFGGTDRDAAAMHLRELRRSGRYQRDVY